MKMQVFFLVASNCFYLSSVSLRRYLYIFSTFSRIFTIVTCNRRKIVYNIY